VSKLMQRFCSDDFGFDPSERTPQIFNKQHENCHRTSRELYTLCFQQALELRSWVEESIQRIHDQKEPIRGR